MSVSRTKTRFYIYSIALIPYLLLLVTGLIMLKYHAGAPPESTVLGLDSHFWFPFHKVTAIITTPIILLHLFVKTNWVINLFKLKVTGAFKKSNVFLFVAFLLCVFTGFGSLTISSALGGIHNKFGLLLLLMFAIHIWNYRKVIIIQLKKE